jgi:hypothetical protein
VLLGVWADVGRTMRAYLDSYTLEQMVDAARGNSVLSPVVS